MKRIYFMILALLTLVGGVNAETVETTLWEGNYSNGIEINSETVATFKAGDVLRVHATVPSGGANFKIVYKSEAGGWQETTIPSIDTQWPWVNGGETYKDIALTAADITALSGQNIYIYKGDNSVITKVGLITTQYTLTVTQPETGGTIKNGESAAVTAKYREGTVVTLEAEATEGYTFVKWTKDGVDAGTETTFNVTVNADMIVSAVFEEVTYVDVTLWTGTQVIDKDWGGNVNLSYGDKGKLSEIFMNDKIRITYKDAGEDAKVRVANPDGWGEYEAESEADATPGDNQTFEYTITSAKILEKIQKNGILGRGKNITITKIELLKVDGRYDAVPVTIGEDGIATFGSSKHLDFTGTGVTPYYATAVESGKVTLTPTDKTRAWSGCIVKGKAGDYGIPVTTEVAWQDYMKYLVSTGEDGKLVYRSAYDDYSGGGDDETQTKIKTYYRYIFAKDGEKNIGFFKLAKDYSRETTEKEGDNESGTTVFYHVLGAHKAYLETKEDITPVPEARLVLRFEDDPTAISEVKSAAQPVKADNVYYNLNGQRVEKPTKGIYILNGKKVLF